MNEETQLIVAPPAPVEKIKLSPEAEQLMEVALSNAALIGKVTNADENAAAAGAQIELKRIVTLFEKSGKALRDPYNAFSKSVIQFVDEKTKDANMELHRISTTIGNFQQLELAKQRAAENAAKTELTQLERDREAALAKVENDEQRDAVLAHYNEQAAQISTPPPNPVRAEGQRVSVDWEITRINEHVLAKARPDLVRRYEFDQRAIKDELKRGVKLPGVEAKEVVNATVSSRGGKAIEV